MTHYQPRGSAPVLFLSAKSRFEAGAPIRGGVPLVFPWFGLRADDPAAPMHGVARLAEWRPVGAARAADGAVTLVLRLDGDAAATPAWPGGAVLEYQVTVGAALELALTVENTTGAPLVFEEALHTYLAVADVRQVSVTGLAGTAYLDSADGDALKREGSAPLALTGETDRVYLETRAACVVDDPAAGRRLVVGKANSDVTVVWNPWEARARALPDLGDDEWPGMLCIESANVGAHAVTLAPGARHTLSVSIAPGPR